MSEIMTELRIKPGYKKTPIGIIPEDWEIKDLGELCNGICGEYGANQKAVEYSPEKPRYIRITDIDDGGNLHKGSKVGANLNDKDLKKYKLESGDLLFARTGATVGKTYLHIDNEEDMVYAGFLIRFRLDKAQTDPIFIKEFTNTSRYWNWIDTYSARSGQPGVNSSEYKSLKIPFPPLKEQKSIANCLSTWDAGIEKLTQLIQTKKQQKKGLMQQLLTGTLRLRSASGEKFDGEWKELRLEEMGKVEYGTRIVKDRTEPGQYYVYGGGGKTFTTKEFNREDNMIIARFAMSEECARFVKGKFFLNDSGLTVKSKEDIFQLFLDYVLFHFQHRIYALRAGGAQQNLDVSALKKIKLRLPPLKEQTAIAEVLQTADQEIELLEQKLAAFQQQKKGLMQVLLTGEKRLIENE